MGVPPVFSGGVSGPQFHRLHPLTIAVVFAKVIGRFALAIAFFVVLWIMDGSSDSTEIVLAGLGAFAVVASVIHYFTFTYAVYDGNLLIRSGLFTKQNRTIPLDRIQNINVQRNLVHRFLGLVDLQIETAAGTGSEAELGSLSEDEADRLKAVLLGHGRSSAPSFTVATTRPKKIVYSASFRELLLAGATENRALAMVFGALGVIVAVPGLMDRIVRIVDRNMNGAEPTPMLIAAGVFGLFLVGWIVSIVTTFVRYWGFQVEEEPGGRITRHYGLFNQIESVIPVRRVQILQFSEGPLQRPFHVGKMLVQTAGSFSEKDMGGQAIVSPLVQVAAVPRLAGAIYPTEDLSHVAWRPVSPRAVWSMFRARVLWCVLSAVAVGVAMNLADWEGYWTSLTGLRPALEAGGAVLVVTLAYSYVDALLTWRVTRYADQPETLCARGGLFRRLTVYVPVDKIQVVDVHRSPVQRKLGLASIHVHTAQGGGSVPDLPEADAEALAASLHDRSMLSTRRLADGL